MSKNKHKFLTFAALMTGATVAVHFINHTIATAAQLKQMLHISNDNYFEWRFGTLYLELPGMNGAKLKTNWQLTIPYILLIC